MKYFFLFYLFFFQVVSAKTVELNIITRNINITNSIGVAESTEIPSEFEYDQSDEIHHNYTSTPVWFSIQLKNMMNISNHFYLYSSSGLIGRLTLLKKDPSTNTYSAIAKDMMGAHQIEGGVHPKFKISLKENESATFLIKREGLHHLDTKFFIGNINSVNKSESDLEKLYIFYIAAILMIFLYNLSVFSFTRDIDFLYYCFFAASIAMTVLIMTGYLERNYLSFEINQHLGAFSSLSLISSILFANSFLNFKDIYPNIRKILMPSLVVATFTLLMNFTPAYNIIPRFFGTLIDLNIILTICLMMYLSIKKVILYNDPLAKVYVFSWFFMYGSAILWFGVYFEIVPYNFFTQNIIIFGNVVEVLILSVALAYKMNILTSEKNKAKEEARNKEKLQKIIRVLSHDIANSIFIILTYTRQKERSLAHFDNDKAWNKVRKAARNIESILTSVKEEQKLENGVKSIEREQVNLFDSLTTALDNFEERANEKNITFIKSFPNKDILIESNNTILIHQIFGNILSNAIKYSHSGSDINITLSNDSNRPIIVIRDYGIGIKMGLIEKVENEKSCFSTVGTQGEQGTGFGLYLVLSYSKALGIDLKITKASTGLGTEVVLKF